MDTSIPTHIATCSSCEEMKQCVFLQAYGKDYSCCIGCLYLAASKHLENKIATKIMDGDI